MKEFFYFFNSANVVAHARSFLGVRWRHRGRDETGIDCVGLVIEALLRSGWQPKNETALRTEYSRRASDDALTELLIDEGIEIEAVPANVRPGDVLVFHFPGDEFPNHVGIVTQGDSHAGGIYFIHACAQKPRPRVREERLADGWLQAFSRLFRVADLEVVDG